MLCVRIPNLACWSCLLQQAHTLGSVLRHNKRGASEAPHRDSVWPSCSQRSKRFDTHFPICIYCCNCCQNKGCGRCCWS
uniref:Hepcidin n=1 Tax=Salvator merianae TaxID=96440 RepID=A0A8D0BMZ5_SALMN